MICAFSVRSRSSKDTSSKKMFDMIAMHEIAGLPHVASERQAGRDHGVGNFARVFVVGMRM